LQIFHVEVALILLSPANYQLQIAGLLAKEAICDTPAENAGNPAAAAFALISSQYGVPLRGYVLTALAKSPASYELGAKC
jgi:hypothetical protein